MIRAMLAGLILLAAAPALADDRQAIEAAAAEWARLYEAQDLDRLMSHYDPAAFVALNNQPAMSGVAAVRAYFTNVFARSTGRMRLRIEDIQVHGDVAHLVSLFRLDGRSRDGQRSWTAVGRSLLLYRRTPDGWKILADIDNSTPDAEQMKQD